MMCFEQHRYLSMKIEINKREKNKTNKQTIRTKALDGHNTKYISVYIQQTMTTYCRYTYRVKNSLAK